MLHAFHVLPPRTQCRIGIHYHLTTPSSKPDTEFKIDKSITSYISNFAGKSGQEDLPTRLSSYKTLLQAYPIALPALQLGEAFL
jgi:hypothetical protein